MTVDHSMFLPPSSDCFVLDIEVGRILRKGAAVRARGYQPSPTHKSDSEPTHPMPTYLGCFLGCSSGYKAGVMPMGLLASATEATFENAMSLNIKGPLFLLQKAAPHIPLTGGGRATFIQRDSTRRQVPVNRCLGCC